MSDTTSLWAAVLLASVGCYLLKWAGMSLPQRALARPGVRKVAGLIPVALLSALVAVQVFADGRTLQLDARAAGIGWAAVALLARAPFLVVVFGAAAVAAGVRVFA